MLNAECKLAAACSVCDLPVREPKRDAKGRVVYGPQHVGTRVARLVHVNGSTSEHSLCRNCDVTPDAFPLLWARALLAYRLGIDRASPVDPHLHYAHNVPIGVLKIRTIERMGER